MRAQCAVEESKTVVFAQKILTRHVRADQGSSANPDEISRTRPGFCAHGASTFIACLLANRLTSVVIYNNLLVSISNQERGMEPESDQQNRYAH